MNKSRRDCDTYEGDEKCIQNLEGKCEEKRPLGRHRCRGKIMLKWALKKEIFVTQDMNRCQSLLNTVTNLRVL